jgi:hypothetical protein
MLAVGVQTAATGLFDRVAVIALGTAVVCGCLRQGGFYAGDAALLLALVVVAVAARLGTGALRVAGPAAAAVAALLAFAGWTVVSAALHGTASDASAPAAVLCGIAGAVWVAAGASAASVQLTRAVVLAAGVVIALTGWVGVALHVEPLALVSSGLWRASSTLTYANATAAFLVITLLLAVATHRPDRRWPGQATVAVLVLGLLATMSRAGLLALAVGLAVCACSAPQRARMATLWPGLAAGVVAAAGLLPALPADAPAQPLPALLGVAAGATALVLPRQPRVLLGVAACAAVLLAPVAALHGIADTRITSASAERDDLSRVTAQQFETSPVTGVGPGRLDFVYVDHTGTVVSAEYTHDEFLQTAGETGVVGLALVLAAFGALAVGALRRWSTPGGPAALAIVAAFGVHSAFDFLWHIPVLPLLVAVAAVPLLTEPDPQPTGTP